MTSADPIAGETAAAHRALREAVAAAPLAREVIEVRGPDAATYLQGQLSQDVEALAPGESTWSLLLAPAGKVDAWLRVSRRAGDIFLIDVDATFGEKVVSRLARFRLRTQVEFTAVRGWEALAVRGPEVAAVDRSALARTEVVVADACWPGSPGFDLLGPGLRPPPGVPLVGSEALEIVRVEAGVPALGAEATESTIPAELGAWLIEASVSFTKGCYTGQELVARVGSRGGNVPRPLRGLVVAADTAPPLGAEVLAGDGAGVVGVLTSVAFSPSLGAPVALAPLARSVPVPGDVSLRWDGGLASAQVRPLPLVAGDRTPTPDERARTGGAPGPVETT